jgi:ATP citrate (pro-S)-lyase
MITARAGRDLPSSLATGLLTIGDRFGGAINNSAKVWYEAVRSGTAVESLLEDFKKRSQYVPGIGHKKYTLYRPDPRVHTLTTFAKKNLTHLTHLTFAEAVAKRTTEKKPNLILNIDGAIASIVLDILIEHEHFSESDIQALLETEFMNSFFIIPRTVGFIGHFLSQKRRDEGLFRLPEDEVFYL